MISFPVSLSFGFFSLSAHRVFESLAYTIAYLAYQRARRRQGDSLGDGPRWELLAVAALGGLLGSRLLALVADPAAFAGDSWGQALLRAKTVTGGLIGGTLAVEAAKWRWGIRQRTGDPQAVALALGIGIGRIGCFLTGISDHTFGDPTTLPWAMDLGDGVLRHPVALYESLYCLALAGLLRRLEGRQPQRGDLFRLFMLGYFGWRFCIEFIKPAPLYGALNAYQWASLLVCLAYSRDALRMARSPWRARA